ncbi:MAG: hypothetical protein EA402_05435 [Planctomycetota bacterium]|nr:MAG: hypothetical protein EA402_05435 [Planctomycetota bacterium]
MTDLAPVVVFHRNCLDGRSSAAVVRRKENGRGTYQPLQYGNKLRHSVLGRRVYILDFALDEDEMRRIAQEASEVIWLDHHASNVELQQRLGWGTLDLSECGATLTWKTLYPDEPMPEVLAYVKDKDLWLWQLPHAREITAGLFATYSDRNFTGLLEADLERMRRKGIPIIKALDERVTKTIGHGVEISEPYGLRDIRALVINAQIDHSDIGALVTKPVSEGGKGLDLAIMFFLRADGRWVHVLRSTSVDCGRIASNRGGGGHPAAASYVADQPFPYSVDCLNWPL